MRNAIFLMFALIASGSGAIDATPQIDELARVRTYNYAAVSAELLSAARSEAEHIFKRARIAIDWIDCRVPGAASGSACTDPLIERRDLMLRLMERPPVNSDDRFVALGESMVDREERRGVLMTIDMSPVRIIARRSTTPIPTLLGRAIAHEIGHLLLGSADHSRLSVMRAQWSNDELRGVKPAHWGFSSREGAQMRQSLRGKQRKAD
jgi:hypothetical protein